MNNNKTLIIILILFSIVFLGLQLFQYEMEASGVRTFLLVLLTALYYSKVKQNRIYFLMFLVTFTISEILNFGSWFVLLYEEDVDYLYYISNGLYILSYTFLILQVLQKINIKDVFSKLLIHILILFTLDVFCVIIVTDTTKSQLDFNQYMVEFAYNAVVMLLLSVALINYIYREDKKSMNFLIGSIFIVFSEVIQLAYFYVSDSNLLNVICSFFLVIAFVFFYLQAQLNNEEVLMIE